MVKLTCVYCGKPFMAVSTNTGSDLTCPNCGSKNMLPLHETSVVQIPKRVDPAQREPGASPVAATAGGLIDNIEKVIVGKHDEIMLTVMAYFAEGHVLLEDVPGVAKTMVARALSRTALEVGNGAVAFTRMAGAGPAIKAFAAESVFRLPLKSCRLSARRCAVSPGARCRGGWR
jgi:DNA-directed RNA polymerase subunit RPC12/RpoP